MLQTAQATAEQMAQDTDSKEQQQTETARKEKPKVALTFDDGPHLIYTEELLDGLKERKVCATFFLIGKNIEGKEELVRRMEEEGHLIGNHTYHHVKLTGISEDQAEQEILETCEKICEVTGTYTSFVRPPFGEWKKNLDFEITMIPVSWNVDSRDWTTQNSEKIVKRVVKDVDEGDIILMHDIFESSVQAALEIIDILSGQGYEFVTVDELLLE
ncbi:MAG TPA: polysaccharide deacetylase family protein [Candidatus Blautia merdavium]|uniref:Polysaccharide deacetylase family protein n=1 Tax=Candidatus Blautia merdavium TaxID=2838494 RepID=A0A9D2PPE4_9FIRM|nr:polysaccharide deacetylase family protein [Candidatus Blautia merdavium]